MGICLWRRTVIGFQSDFKESYENTELESWQRYSASVGLSDYEEGDTSIESIFKRADKKMYEEKLKFKARYGIDLESRV